MVVTERLLPVNPFSRPGTSRVDDLAVVMHWTAAPGQEADVTARYFELLAQQDARDDRPDRYASAHYIVGIDGQVLRVIPEHEVAYHVGANDYTVIAQRRFPGYTSNGRMGTPNWCTIGIELCHPDASGRFTDVTVAVAQELVLDILDRCYLGPRYSLMRHYDITGKRCPRWWVEHGIEWDEFVRSVEEARRKQR